MSAHALTNVHGVGLTNAQVVASVRASRDGRRRAEENEAVLVALLRRRADGDPTAWAEAAPRFHPARPEAPEAALEALDALKATLEATA